METLWISGVGFFVGFGFGVGCALAVMSSIYTEGIAMRWKTLFVIKNPNDTGHFYQSYKPSSQGN